MVKRYEFDQLLHLIRAIFSFSGVAVNRKKKNKMKNLSKLKICSTLVENTKNER